MLNGTFESAVPGLYDTIHPSRPNEPTQSCPILCCGSVPPPTLLYRCHSCSRNMLLSECTEGVGRQAGKRTNNEDAHCRKTRMRGADKIEAYNLYYTSSKVYEVKMVVDDDLEDCFKINHIKFISSLLLITPSDSDKVGHDPQTLNSHGIDCGDAGWMDGW